MSDSQGLSELTKIFLTADLTVFGGLVVLVGGQAITRFIIEPIHEQRRAIKAVAYALHFYENEYMNPGLGKQEAMDETSRVLRASATELLSTTAAIPLRGLRSQYGTEDPLIRPEVVIIDDTGRLPATRGPWPERTLFLLSAARPVMTVLWSESEKLQALLAPSSPSPDNGTTLNSMKMALGKGRRAARIHRTGLEQAQALVSVALVALCIGCAHAPPPKLPHIPLTPPAELCANPSLGPDSLCLPAERIAALLQTARFNVLQVKNPTSGIGGSKVLVLSLPDDNLTIKVKWKQSKPGGNGMNNTPRKEIAAYQLQKLFLEPDEYVVPPTIGRCVQPASLAYPLTDKEWTFEGVACVYGVLSYWIENVSDENVLDRQRIQGDAAYRASLARMNLLTYLINHRDTRRTNFVISKDPKSSRTFSIDNGLAFSGLRNPRQLFLHEWNFIIVPSLPRAQIDKLRRVTRADLDKLAVVAQYEMTPGALTEVEPTAAFDPGDGVRRSGSVLQLGLTKREIESMEARLKHLLEKIDKGKIPLF